MNPIWIALGGMALFSIAGWVMAWRSTARVEQLKQELDSMQSDLRRELAAVNMGSVGVGQRLITVEKRINLILEKQQDVTASNGYLPYSEAADLMERGAEVKHLIDRCGLSEAEAELMSLMRGQVAH